jgi:pyrroline-5-carboxylate reductase
MSLTQQHHLFFLGAGSIGEAMIKGITSARLLPAEQITISNRNNAQRLQELQSRYDIQLSQDKLGDIAEADIVILAMKPFDLVKALQEVGSVISEKQLIISLVAGVSTALIEENLPPSVPVVRAMPNTSSFVQASSTALCQGRWAKPAHLAIACDLFSAIGISVTIPESLMDAATGLSGTGPAYIYYVVEALLKGGQACGLSTETCRTLLLQTVYGAAKMLQETDQEPAALRRQVTSPNGTTMAAISVLDQGNGQQLFQDAVIRATQRAAEMGQQIALTSNNTVEGH